jgi:hypothetical protein
MAPAPCPSPGPKAPPLPRPSSRRPPLDRTILAPVWWRRLAGYAVAAILLAGVAWTLTAEHETLRRTWESVRTGGWWRLVIWLLLPTLNWVFSSHLAWALLRPQPLVDPDEIDSQPRLTRPEMYEVIGAAWLANLLPLRAGLVSRAVYHTTVNRIPLGTVVRSVFVSIALGLIVSLVLVPASALAVRFEVAPLVVVMALLAPYPVLRLLGGASPVADQGSPFTGGFGRWRLLDAAAARYADMLVWMLRYWIAFGLAGHTVTIAEAAVFAAVSQLAMIVPLPGNALGLREMTIGFLAPLLPASVLGGSGELTRAMGVTADLVNRLPELASTLAIGGACTLLLAQRLRFRLD